MKSQSTSQVFLPKVGPDEKNTRLRSTDKQDEEANQVENQFGGSTGQVSLTKLAAATTNKVNKQTNKQTIRN